LLKDLQQQTGIAIIFVNVRFGLLSDISANPRNVCFTPCASCLTRHSTPTPRVAQLDAEARQYIKLALLKGLLVFGRPLRRN
jgi:hypothetical protein